MLPRLITGIGDGVKVMIDPTGGQGLQMIPVLGDLLKLFNVNVLDFPGNATYITYDSGNLRCSSRSGWHRICSTSFRALTSRRH